MEELQRAKKSLKQWESEFFHEKKRKPSKEDLENAPENITKMYKRYLELKTAVAAGKPVSKPPVEVWGKELNKSSATTAKRQREAEPAAKQSYMHGIGKKLLDKSSVDTSNKSSPVRRPPVNNEDDDDDDDNEMPLNRPSVFGNAMKYASGGKQGQSNAAGGKKTSFMNRAPVVSYDEPVDEDGGYTATDLTQLEAGDDPDDVLDYAAFTGKKQAKKKVESETKRALDVSPSGSEAEDGGNDRSESLKKGKGASKERKKKRGRDDGDFNNDNFVRLNMKTKKYKPKGGAGGGPVGPGGKRLTWKQRMQQRLKNKGTCFKCGEEGHWARECRNPKEPPEFGFGNKEEEVPPCDFKPTGMCFKCGQEGHWARHCKGQGNKPQIIDFAPELTRRVIQEPAATLDYDPDRMVADNEFPTMEEAVLMSRGIKTALHPGCAPPVDTSDEFYEADAAYGIVRAPYKKPAPLHCMPPLYKLNPDGSLPETPPEVYQTLEQFGFLSFRPGQETAIMRVLCGLSTLVVLSTGAGKSLCYQLPAYLYAKRSRCITLVVSPLVSLMQDQVSELPEGLHGACIHTNMTPIQRRNVMESVTTGKFHFLLLSPEMLVGGGGVYSGLSSVLNRLPPIAFVCIDEAHCVSEWSHHFRPSYLRVCSVLREQFGVKCMLGLTATATMTTAYSVAQHLGIVEDATSTIRGAPIPENLKLSVSRDVNKEQGLIKLLRGALFSRCQSIIVYCTRREQTARVASLIRSSMKDFFGGDGGEDSNQDTNSDGGSGGENSPKCKRRKKKKRTGFRRRASQAGSWKAECYHAGMSAIDRKNIQEDFMSGKLRVVVATVAFGMGLNKSDIRGVVHFNMPKNIESYVQEIGRAGRDGETAYCHLFLDCKGEDRNELKRHIFSRSVDRVAVKKLVRRVFVPCRCRQPTQKETKTTATDDTEPQPEAADVDNDIDAEATAADATTDTVAADTVAAAAAVAADADNDDVTGDATTAAAAGCDHTLEGFDISGLDTPWDEEEERRNTPSPVSQHRQTACPGHERSLPVDDLVRLLDMKEEVIETLLCYLELHTKQWIENLQPVFSTCILQFYGGKPQMLSVSKKCPPVAVAIAKQKQLGGSLDSLSNKLEFNLIELSDLMGWDSAPVKKELKLLEWDLVPGGSRKTGVTVEFSSISYHIRSPGDMSDDELDEVVDFLMERIETQEKTELYHLANFHETLRSVSYKNVTSCCDFPDTERSERLRTQLHRYLEVRPPAYSGVPGAMPALSFSRESEAVEACQLDAAVDEEVCDKEEAIRADVRAFHQLYSEEHKLTGRAIARIFQGIDSPRFPATVWGRVRRFWRNYLDVDFHVLRRIATREILRCR